MRLKNGDKAIDFAVHDYLGNEIRLSDYNNKKILLSFYRYAGCPLCNLRLHDLATRYSEYSKKGLVVISFFESPKENIQKYLKEKNPPFAVIPDPDRLIYAKYRVEHSLLKYIKGVFTSRLVKALLQGFMPGKMEGVLTLVPADFLIKNSIIQNAYYGKDVSDHLQLYEIERFLEE